MNFIIKNHHKNNYTIIYNRFLQDKDLNLELKGFGGYLLNKPPNWIININQLSCELNVGKDKILRLINRMIELGYMYRHKKDVAFVGKGELKNLYYFCDDKELLNKTTEPFRSVATPPQLSLSTFPPLEAPSMDTAPLESPVVVTPSMENTSHTNINYYKKDIEKEDNNKKKTQLTTNLSIRPYLKEILDDFTIVNLLNAKPDLTVDEFIVLYEKATLEFKGGYCNNINSCLVKAAGGKWTFRYNISNSSSNDDTKNHRVLKGKLNYYIDYFGVGSCSKDEILGKFLNECQKYDENLVNPYYRQLKEKLESN
ncbi:MAG: hypothetical protein ACRC8M_07140 [Cetobacterium sp.]|uniref:hypothetical protein n=1 Tax=Cetobacterium sp. TaxID=2071632 RepID=UPI003F2D2533